MAFFVVLIVNVGLLKEKAFLISSPVNSLPPIEIFKTVPEVATIPSLNQTTSSEISFKANRFYGDLNINTLEKLKEELTKMGVLFLIDSPSNQQFPILPDSVLKELSKKYVYNYQQRMDETHSAVRFCTCWATKAENVDALLSDIKSLLLR